MRTVYGPGGFGFTKTTGDCHEHFVTQETHPHIGTGLDPDPQPYVVTVHGEILRVTDHATGQATIEVNTLSISDDPNVTEYSNPASILGQCPSFVGDDVSAKESTVPIAASMVLPGAPRNLTSAAVCFTPAPTLWWLQHVGEASERHRATQQRKNVTDVRCLGTVYTGQRAVQSHLAGEPRWQ